MRHHAEGDPGRAMAKDGQCLTPRKGKDKLPQRCSHPNPKPRARPAYCMLKLLGNIQTVASTCGFACISVSTYLAAANIPTKVAHLLTRLGSSSTDCQCVFFLFCLSLLPPRSLFVCFLCPYSFVFYSFQILIL